MLLSRATLIAFASFFTVVHCSPIQAPYAVKDNHHVPRKWTRVGDAPPHAIIKLEIALKQSRFDELERHLYEGNG